MAIYETSLNPYELAVADSLVIVVRPFKVYVLADFAVSAPAFLFSRFPRHYWRNLFNARKGKHNGQG